ncbi:hypothetical protein, partial [Escherichia coli]|uniref:hypothetical protein n=1 Tax=Escherichia coli TaxID=562 RepID=UPI0013D54BB4
MAGLGLARQVEALELEKALIALKKDKDKLTEEDLRKLGEQAKALGLVAVQAEYAKDAQNRAMDLE